MPKPKLKYWDLFDQVWFVIKTKQDNGVVDCTSAVYAENEVSYHD